MNHLRRLLLVLFATLTLTACGEQEEGRFSGTAILSGEHVIQEGETVEGVVLLVDGMLRVEEDARVEGAIYVLARALEVEGEVTGDLSILGGALAIGPRAEISGRLNVGGGTVARSPAATVGEVVETDIENMIPLDLTEPERSLSDRLRDFLLQTSALAILACLLARFIPQPVSRVALAVAEHPLAAGAYGLLVGIVTPALLVIMALLLTRLGTRHFVPATDEVISARELTYASSQGNSG
ncbi:MAG: polymer-forming cytoskeletal protein [Chloroflexota bacterium]|nr:polymer-forming cytoskeletal protein [Chloroflexota bacterium]